MNDLAATIGRVRRAMPRNADVMAVCDAAEAKAVTSPVTSHETASVTSQCPVCEERRAAHRERVRGYRAVNTLDPDKLITNRSDMRRRRKDHLRQQKAAAVNKQ